MILDRDFRVLRTNIERAFADVLEVPLSAVQETLEFFVNQGFLEADEYEFPDVVTPAEARAILDLLLFRTAVEISRCKEDQMHVYVVKCTTFYYHNLNSGRSLVWVNLEY
jgi:hypothetical protein